MDSLHFEAVITTPSGTPLGGHVSVDVSKDGSWRSHIEMKSSSIFSPFDYNVRAYLSAPGFTTLAFLQNGHVDADDSDTHDESGVNPLISVYWKQLETAPIFTVAKDYKWSGVVGTIADLFDDLVDVLAGGVGATLGVVIGLTRDAIGWLGATLGPGATIGVIGGFLVFVIAAAEGVALGGALIAGLVTAVSVGAIAGLLLSSRPLTGAERTVAAQVFGDNLPWDDIVLTDLAGLSGRAFTAAGIDGKIYVNLGNVYKDPLGPAKDPYPFPGQTLIHELVHVWQIKNSSFLPGLMCSMIVTQAGPLLGDDVYAYGAPGQPWHELNPEQQAAIVDQWFGASGNGAGYKSMDQQSPYFDYIWNDFWQRTPPAEAPANLRAASSSSLAAISPAVGEVELFWVAGDGSVRRQRSEWGSPEPVLSSTSATAGSWSSLAAVARIPGTLEIFVLGTGEGVTDLRWATGAAPSIPPPPPTPPPSALAVAASGAALSKSPIAAVARTPNNLDVFWIGPDSAVATQWWTSDPTQDWGTHGQFNITSADAAQPDSGLCAVARRTGHLDVFWIGPHNEVCSTWSDATDPRGAWADHSAFDIAPPGAARTGSPVVTVSRTPDHLDVFWIGPDNAICSHFWDAAPGGGWSDHQPFEIAGPGSARADSPLAVATRNQIHLDVFWLGPDGSVMTQWWDANGPQSGWADHSPFPIAPGGSANTGSPITAVAFDANHLDVFWVGPDGAIWMTWWSDVDSNGAWSQHPPVTVTPPGAIAPDFATANTAATALIRQAKADANAGNTVQALQETVQAVEVLETAAVGPDDEPAFHLALAEARHDQIARLVDVGQHEQALMLAPSTFAEYQRFAARPGGLVTQVLELVEDLKELVGLLLAAGATTADAVNNQQKMLEIMTLAGPSPDPSQIGEYNLDLTEARQKLLERYIDDGRPGEAIALASQVISGYQADATTASADQKTRIVADLNQLSGQLSSIGDPTDAATASSAAAAIQAAGT